MPNVRKAVTAAQELYSSILRSHEHDVVTVTVDVSSLTTAEVDADGVIKPGVILQENGALISAAAQNAYAIVHEADGLKIPGVDTNTTLATDPDFRAALATNCVVSRAEIERQLGRVLSANELAALATEKSHIILEQ